MTERMRSRTRRSTLRGYSPEASLVLGVLGSGLGGVAALRVRLGFIGNGNGARGRPIWARSPLVSSANWGSR